MTVRQQTELRQMELTLNYTTYDIKHKIKTYLGSLV